MKINSKYFGISLIIAFIISSCGSENGSDNNASVEQFTPIAGYELAPTDLSRIVRVSSLVEPLHTITIASRKSGLITTMNVREGDRVNAGDILLEFDTEEEEVELIRARAELDYARAVYDRLSRLLDREAISQAEYDEAKSTVKISEANIQLLETRLAFGTVRAPKQLVILERHVENGDAVSTNAPLFRVADLNNLVIRAGIPERDIVSISQGQQVHITIDAYPGTDFSGTVERIFPSADTDSRLITVEISVEPEQHGKRIRPGFLARVRLEADQRNNILAIPSEALLASTRDEKFVYLINDEDRLERRDVVLGIERRNWTEILDGLEEGDFIVGGNPGALREELLVTVSRWVENATSPRAVN